MESKMIRALALLALLLAAPAYALPTGDYAFDIQRDGATYSGTFHDGDPGRTLLSLSLPAAYTAVPVVVDIVNPTPWPLERDVFPVFAYSVDGIYKLGDAGP